jgi:hypothetical protein
VGTSLSKILFKPTKAQQQKVCLKNLSLIGDKTVAKVKRGETGMEVRSLLGRALPVELKSLHFILQVKEITKYIHMGLNHLGKKPLFMLCVCTSSPVII